MSKETRDEIRPEEAAASEKKAWIAPRIEAIRGSDAAASFSRSGSADYGLYS